MASADAASEYSDFVPHAAHPSAFASFEGRVLIVASVTIGNVPQLACDLLVSSASGERVGRLRSRALLPFAGLSGSGEVLTGAEVYELRGGAILLQHHAPPSRGRASEHAAAVLAFARAARFSEVLLLASANAAGRRDAQLLRQTGRFAGVRVAAAASGAASPCIARLASANVPNLETCDDKGVWRPGARDDEGEAADVAFLPLTRTAGFVRAALDAAVAHGTPLAMVLMFAHEGENSDDASALACVVAHAAEVEVAGAGGGDAAKGTLDRFLPHFTVPEAWNAIAPPPAGLY